MSEEQINSYYRRIEKLLNGANKETYGFVPEEIRQILRWYEDLQQENKQLKEEKEELKKWLEEILNELKENDIYDRTSYEIGQIVVIESIIAKIEELEEGVK